MSGIEPGTFAPKTSVLLPRLKTNAIQLYYLLLIQPFAGSTEQHARHSLFNVRRSIDGRCNAPSDPIQDIWAAGEKSERFFFFRSECYSGGTTGAFCCHTYSDNANVRGTDSDVGFFGLAALWEVE